MQNIEETLREKKIKVTPQRMAVYAILKGTKSHPNVEMIYQQLKPDYPAMSLATVYKTVDVLKKVGLVQELNVGDGGLRYDSTTIPHSHVYCEKCSKVEDANGFSLDILEDKQLLEKVNKQTGYEITSTQLYFYGICPQCNN